MSTIRRRVATAAAAAGVALSPAVAAAPASADHTPSADRSYTHPRGHKAGHVVRDLTDAQFLARAARSNQFEIVTGELAQQRAASDAVKALGAMFVTHHTQQLAAGAAVAQQLGIPVPKDLSPAQRAQVDLLSRLSGRRFDRAWIRIQLLAHIKAVNLHLAGALTGDTKAVRDLALAGLPVVVTHLRELLELSRGGQPADH